MSNAIETNTAKNSRSIHELGQVITANTVVDPRVDFYFCDASAGTINITLESAADNLRNKYFIKTDTSNNDVVIRPAAGDTTGSFQHPALIVLECHDDSVSLRASTPTNWEIVSNHTREVAEFIRGPSMGTTLVTVPFPASNSLSNTTIFTQSYTNNYECPVLVESEAWMSATFPLVVGEPYSNYIAFWNETQGGVHYSKVESVMNGNYYNEPETGVLFWRPTVGGDVQNRNVVLPGATVDFDHKLIFRNIDGMDVANPLQIEVFYGGTKMTTHKLNAY